MRRRKTRALCAGLCSAAALAVLPTLASGATFEATPDLIAAPANNVGVHSMLYQDTPYSAKKEMFAQAKAVGASYIRLDLGLTSIFTRGEYRGHPFYQKNWAQTDQYAELANRYGVKILANLYATPWFIADCPAGTSREDAYHCPPSDLVRYKEMVAEVSARYAGVIDAFEIINEPDTARAFYGSPQQYARTLSAAADGVHGANPKARVAIGGVARISDTQFTDAVLAADPSLPAKIDINTIHLRTSARAAATLVDRWRKYFTSHGMNGPLWLTEFGYPAETVFQYDAKFRGGESAQAAFLEATMPGIVGAGAEMIFVTERDWGSGAFASEGILSTTDPLPANPAVRRKPAFDVVRSAAASLVPVALPAPPGTVSFPYSKNRSAKVVGKAITLNFACVSAGICPTKQFRLTLTNGSAYRVVSPAIPAGGTAALKLTLTKVSLRLLARANAKSIVARLIDTKSVGAGSIRIRE
jgi:hypothetical protein